MKTEEQVLLSYMYEKGYTDEDMYDERIMNEVRNSTAFRIHLFKLGYPKVFEGLNNLVKRIVNAFAVVAESVREMWPIIKEVSLEEPELPRYKTFSLINFSKRTLIQHQVIDRKPKHITRKIIH